MDQQVQIVTLAVSDIERSRDFYSDGLGWTPVLAVPGEVVFYQIGHGLLLSLFNDDDFAGESNTEVVKGNSFNLGHLVGSDEGVDAVLDLARGAGATILKEGCRADWGGYHGFFADPDGYIWEIAYNAGFSTDANGRVSISPVE